MHIKESNYANEIFPIRVSRGERHFSSGRGASMHHNAAEDAQQVHGDDGQVSALFGKQLPDSIYFFSKNFLSILCFLF